MHLVSGMDKQLFDVSICDLGDLSHKFREMAETGGVRVFSVPQGGMLDLGCLFGLSRLIGRFKPHIVNTFLFTSDLYGRIAAVARGVPVIISSLRNVDVWKKGHHRLLDRILAKKTASFTANADAVRQHLAATLNVDQGKVAVIYNGVDARRFSHVEPPTGLREQLRIGRDKKVLLTIARFVPQKDHRTLIEAAGLVLQKRSDVLFLLISESGNLGDVLTGTIGRAGLMDYFRIFGFQEKIEDFYHVADVSVLTSLYEGCSNFILESMACGLPIVATRVGGNPELIQDGGTGFLVSPKSPRETAEKILHLLDNPSHAREFGERAAKRVRESFTVERMVRGYQELYVRLYRAWEAERKT
jgi:glycosyltransferase involved in cell wall biosynthesis